MEVIIRPDEGAVAEAALDVIGRLLASKRGPVMGLATGRTPLKLYAAMRASGLDFSAARFFNLDELVGLGPEHPDSFRRFLRANLLDGLGAAEGAARFLDGAAPDLEREAAEYEAAIRAAGGIDLQILGLGRNGHIGFNEPGSSLGSRTRPKALDKETLADYGPDTPRFSVTMGIGTILEARALLMLATGEGKAEAVRRVAEGPLSSETPGSALQLHPRVYLIVDEAAASRLARAEYWRWVWENKWRVGQ
ncbi:MAG: glucosamine-6-phosphate deaminase [Elusimicrobia bacterium]|nr:glucosamine-6-phosphate deaminase [Elusimicrobiota bacterium]